MAVGELQVAPDQTTEGEIACRASRVSRRASKVDDNQKEIVAVFRQLGCSVVVTSMMGAGFPDLVVARAGRTICVEVKDGAKAPSKRKLTPDQQEFHAAWRGVIEIVETIDDAIAAAKRHL
jgi:hypothetical protein